MYKEVEFNLESHQNWMKERSAAMATMKQSHFVTISREYGCDGYPTAVKLCELINKKRKNSPWAVITHPVMEKLVSDEELGAELIDRVSEARYSFVNWFIDGFVPDHLKSTPSKVFQRIQTLILNLAEKGNCIILGIGAQIITNELDPLKFNGIHARIIGSHPVRLSKVMEKFGLHRNEAEKQLHDKQKARDKFIADFTGKSLADKSLYHMVFNNDRNTPEMMAKTILAYLEIRGIV